MPSVNAHMGCTAVPAAQGWVYRRPHPGTPCVIGWAASPHPCPLTAYTPHPYAGKKSQGASTASAGSGAGASAQDSNKCVSWAVALNKVKAFFPLRGCHTIVSLLSGNERCCKGGEIHAAHSQPWRQPNSNARHRLYVLPAVGAMGQPGNGTLPALLLCFLQVFKATNSAPESTTDSWDNGAAAAAGEQP